ncbi:MAG: hypothetical protein ACRCTP_04290 [Aeromonas popoffii]|uniref:ATP-dependent DNA ligase n=1 Tax=Aeromonas popoffii TaxID=70856 RepID=UPI003F35ACA6
MSVELRKHIRAITEAKGPNAKIAYAKGLILSNPVEAEELSWYLGMVYSGQNWYQTKIGKPGALAMIGKPSVGLREGISAFFSGERRGSAGATRLGVLSASLKTQEERELLQFSLWADIKASFGPKSINKVWPDLIFIPPYQRCATYDKGYHLAWNWQAGVYVQEKEDQMFGNLICDHQPKLFSRNFNAIDCPSSITGLTGFAKEVWEYFDEPVVIHGELKVRDDGTGDFLGREASNGLVNGIIQTGSDLPEGYSAHMVVWDVIPLGDFYAGHCAIEYHSRFDALVDTLNVVPSNNIRLVTNAIVKDINEVKGIFGTVVAKKGEGLVIKSSDGIWQDTDGGSGDAIKLKIEMVVELQIIDFKEAEAKSKHSGTFASLQCRSSDGRIVTGVSGMTDEMRAEMDANRDEYRGAIISARCNGIQWNPEEPHSLYFAQFVEVRRDKATADTLEDIVSVQESAIMNKLMSKDNSNGEEA